MIRHRSGVLNPRTLTRPLTRAVAGTALAALVALGVPAQPQTADRTVSGQTLAPAGATTISSYTYERRVQRLVNVRRAHHGLPRLRFASCPDGTAERWSRYLALQDAFYHQSMTSVLDRCHAMYAGETLGRGTMSPHRLVRMWMQSPAHREVLLSPKSRRIGVGANRDVFGRWVVAANFVRF
jgi:uncharacterized protein YkwD